MDANAGVLNRNSPTGNTGSGNQLGAANAGILNRNSPTGNTGSGNQLVSGNGAVLNNNPYDVAAAKLICEEAGVVLTDASGNSLDDRPLIGSGADYCVSTVVSATQALHAQVIGSLDRGIAKLRERMSLAEAL